MTDAVGLAASHDKLTAINLLGFEPATTLGQTWDYWHKSWSAVTVFLGNEGQPLDLGKALLPALLQDTHSR